MHSLHSVALKQKRKNVKERGKKKMPTKLIAFTFVRSIRLTASYKDSIACESKLELCSKYTRHTHHARNVLCMCAYILADGLLNF